MKRICLILAGLLALATAARAVPAYPYPIKVRQPDGSYITIQLHGDEFCNWATSDGYLVDKGSDGWWRRSAPLSARKAAPGREARQRAMAARIERDRAFRSSAATFSKGNNRFLVILVEFADLSFTVPNAQQAFWDMLNKEGYSDNGGTGSVKDYYSENSRGAFNPTFDVYGPVRISGGFADYGGNNSGSSGYSAGSDKNPKRIVEACDTLYKYGTVNFADYDNDHDGIVDNIFFYYAGYNEAEGGGPDTIWPHASSFGGAYARTYNGVSLGGYNCSSEYKGSEGGVMAGIGTFCHEFGHRLGLPDFYDTDYEVNGQSDGLMAFSLMSSGNYNNAGRTPPYLTAIERGMLGWMGAPKALTSSGSYTLAAVQENAAYTSPTDNEGEYFLYETRTGTGWDSAIASNPPAQGMLIYHIDQSDYKIDGVSAKTRWENWDGINDYEVHPCMYIKYAKQNPSSYAEMPFPGTAGVTEFSDLTTPASKAWDGVSTGYNLSDIAYADGKTTFTLTIDNRRIVLGTVRNTSGEAIEGASVTITDATSSGVQKLMKGKLISQQAIKRLGQHSVTTGADGSFSIELDASEGSDLVLTVSKSGFRTYTLQFSHDKGKTRKDVVLKRVDEGNSADLKKYTESNSYNALGLGQSKVSLTVGTKFTPEELAPYVGMKIKQIDFLFYGTNATSIEALVDFDSQRVCTKTVYDPGFYSNGVYYFTHADVSDADIIIPADKDVYIGFSMKEVYDTQQGDDYYPLPVDATATEPGGGYYKEYSTVGGGWYELSLSGNYYNVIVSCTVEDNVSPFFAFKILSILNPKPEGYSVGDTFNFALMDVGLATTSVAWYFDGAVQSSPSIELSSAGRHKVKALVTLEDGSTQEIEQEIEVK